MLERQVGMARLERTPAPDALAAIALENAARALGRGEIGSKRIAAVHARMMTQSLRPPAIPATTAPLATAPASVLARPPGSVFS